MKLTRDQRFLIFRGAHPSITFSAREPCPVEVGHVQRLSSQVELEVIDVRRTKNGDWALVYVVRDHRPNLLRRVPPVHTFESDEMGEVLPPTPADIEAARLESSYTHSSLGAIGDAGEGLPEPDQKLLTMRARSKMAERKSRDPGLAESQVREDARRLAALVRDNMLMMVRSGTDPSEYLAEIQRAAQQAEDQCEAA